MSRGSCHALLLIVLGQLLLVLVLLELVVVLLQLLLVLLLLLGVCIRIGLAGLWSRCLWLRRGRPKCI